MAYCVRFCSLDDFFRSPLVITLTQIMIMIGATLIAANLGASVDTIATEIVMMITGGTVTILARMIVSGIVTSVLTR